jgi:hypothetical protein
MSRPAYRRQAPPPLYLNLLRESQLHARLHEYSDDGGARALARPQSPCRGVSRVNLRQEPSAEASLQGPHEAMGSSSRACVPSSRFGFSQMFV